MPARALDHLKLLDLIRQDPPAFAPAGHLRQVRRQFGDLPVKELGALSR